MFWNLEHAGRKGGLTMWTPWCEKNSNVPVTVWFWSSTKSGLLCVPNYHLLIGKATFARRGRDIALVHVFGNWWRLCCTCSGLSPLNGRAKGATAGSIFTGGWMICWYTEEPTYHYFVHTYSASSHPIPSPFARFAFASIHQSTHCAILNNTLHLIWNLNCNSAPEALCIAPKTAKWNLVF